MCCRNDFICAFPSNLYTSPAIYRALLCTGHSRISSWQMKAVNAETAAITHLRDVDIPAPVGNNLDWWHSVGKPGISQYKEQWFKGQVPVLTVPPRSPAIWLAQTISAGYQGIPPILSLLQHRSAGVAQASASLHSSGRCNLPASSSTAGCIQSHNTAFALSISLFWHFVSQLAVTLPLF